MPRIALSIKCILTKYELNNIMIKIIDWLALLKVAKKLKHEKVKRMGMESILEYVSMIWNKKEQELEREG